MEGLEVEIVDDPDDRQVLSRPPDPELLSDRIGEPDERTLTVLRCTNSVFRGD